MKLRLMIGMMAVAMVLPAGARTLGASARLAVAMDAGHASRAARFYSMILDVDDEAVLEQLEWRESQVLYRRDNLVLAFVSTEAMEWLSGAQGVRRAELSPRLNCNLLTARVVTNVDAVQQGYGEVGALTGRGVVAGFSDRGFDPNHAAFDSRVALLTNYVDTIAQVDRLSTPAEIAAWSTDYARDYHATHVAGIMAGGEAGGDYRGVAPEATIVATTSILHDAGILAGVEDVIAYARQGDMPAVVNLSLSSNIGPHDGSDLYCQYLDRCADDAVIVVAAGNSGESKLNISHTFSGEGDSIATRVLDKIDWTGMAIYGNADLWSADERGCRVRLRVYDVVDRCYVYASPWVGEGGDTDAVIVQSTDAPELSPYFSGAFGIVADRSPYTGRAEVLAQYNLKCTTSYTNSWARYCVVLEARGEEGVSVDLTADDEYTYFTTLTSTIASTKADSHLSVGSSSCGRKVVIAGSSTTADCVPLLDGGTEAFDHVTAGTVSQYSSYGTLRDGRTLPHVCAPGAYIISAVSNPWLKRNFGMRSHLSAESPTAPGNYYMATCGTSMAAPHVAGVFALWLQADPTLTPAELREIACESASYNGVDPMDPRVGYGVIDAAAGLQMVIDRAGLSVNPTALRPILRREGGRLLIEAAVEPLLVRVFDMMGRAVDPEVLPAAPVVVQVTTEAETFAVTLY
ncbi:MAG: S8 family serine peptidase [Muribaculaceae bacterium]